MKKILLPLLLLFCMSMTAQINETFESGTATENWRAFAGATNGKYLGVVDNPKKDKTNSSNKCIGYVKGASAYSLFGDSLIAPLNLTTNTLFKIQIYANRDAKTTFIFKLEGPKGAKEVAAKIPTTRGWRDYAFDLSGLVSPAKDSINRIYMFFDNGVDASTDTFYIDNVLQLPPTACAGTVPVIRILDDFECQRNANYGYSYDSLTVIPNFDKSGINTSSSCGKYVRRPNESYVFVLHDNYTPIDLSTFNYMRVKVWAPHKGIILLKLEGDGTAAKEVRIPLTDAQAMKWVEVGADMSGATFAGNTRALVFFDADFNQTATDTYYIDDWQFTTQPALEDFEPTAKLSWGPFQGNAAQHGSFVLATNPTPNSVNNSSSVGKYTKGSAAISVLTGTLPTGFLVDALAPQANLQVLTPAGSAGKTVTVQLASATKGNISADATIDSAGVWDELKFDLSAAVGLTDISSINVIFDKSAAAPGAMYFFDNLRFGKSTLNPCLGVAPVPNIINDFECQQNIPFDATTDLVTVKNPVPSDANSSSSVGKYTRPNNDKFINISITYQKAIDLSKFNQLNLQVYGGPGGKIPILFKLDGGTSGGKEIYDTLRTNNTWQSFKIDFSGVKANNYKKIILFFNAGVLPANADVYYIDNLQWTSEPVTGCLTNFETPIKFTYFADDTLDGRQPRLVTNPKKTGINTSATVLEFKRLSSVKATVFQGMYTDLGTTVKWTTNKIIVKAKVLMDHIGNVGFKLEGAPGGAEIPIANTKVNEWEELTADFGTKGITGNEGFTRVTLFVDLNLPLPAADQTTYLDDITIGEVGSCTTTGVFDPIRVDALSVFPNPVSEVLVVRNAQSIRRLDVTNLLGQRVKSTPVSNLNDDFNISVSELAKGMYIISAFDENGKLSANAKFTKE